MDNLSNFPAVIALIGWSACLWVDLKRGIHRICTGHTAVFVSVLMWYLLEALRTPNDLLIYRQSEYNLGLVYLAVAMASFLWTYHRFRFNFFGSFARRLPMLSQPRVLWLLVLTGMTVGLGSIIIYSGFDLQEPFRGLIGPRPRWTALGRGRYGSWSTLIFELQVFLLATVPLAISLAFMRQSSLLPRIVSGLFVVWMVLRTFWSGTRTPMIPIVLSLGAAFYWSTSPRWRLRLLILGIPLVLMLGYFWSAMVVAGRNAGTFASADAQEVDYIGFEMFRELLFIVRSTNDGMPLQYGMTYFTQLVNPIPRAIWPGKPVADAGLILARAYGAVDETGEATMTTSPGFVGEAYLNFGLLGIFLVPAFAGIVIRSWDDLLPVAARSLPTFIVYAGGVATILMSGRSFNFSTFYGLLCLYGLMLIFDYLQIASPIPVSASPLRRQTSPPQYSPSPAR